MLTILFFVFLPFVRILQAESIVSFENGIQFSSCTGYCYKSVFINATTIVTFKKSLTNSSDYPQVQQHYSVESSYFNQLLEFVGNIQVWKAIDKPIGCPDCSNQGLEWVEIDTDEQPPYAVIFDGNETISSFQSLVTQLRSIRQTYFP